jgi:hypothetical protein
MAQCILLQDSNIQVKKIQTHGPNYKKMLKKNEFRPSNMNVETLEGLFPHSYSFKLTEYL